LPGPLRLGALVIRTRCGAPPRCGQRGRLVHVQCSRAVCRGTRRAPGRDHYGLPHDPRDDDSTRSAALVKAVIDARGAGDPGGRTRTASWGGFESMSNAPHTSTGCAVGSGWEQRSGRRRFAMVVGSFSTPHMDMRVTPRPRPAFSVVSRRSLPVPPSEGREGDGSVASSKREIRAGR